MTVSIQGTLYCISFNLPHPARWALGFHSQGQRGSGDSGKPTPGLWKPRATAEQTVCPHPTPRGQPPLTGVTRHAQRAHFPAPPGDPRPLSFGMFGGSRGLPFPSGTSYHTAFNAYPPTRTSGLHTCRAWPRWPAFPTPRGSTLASPFQPYRPPGRCLWKTGCGQGQRSCAGERERH